MENSCTWKFCKFLLSTLLFVILMVPILLVLLIFLIYRTLVLIILKVKFGSKFGGLLGGLDAFIATDPSFRNVINTIMIIKTRHGFQELFCKLKETVNTKIFKNEHKFPKFLSTRHKMYGYHYFLTNQIKIDECFRSLNMNWENEEISKEELLKGISIYSSETLPYNNTAFWEILLCEKPVRWYSTIEKDTKSYAIYLRFHHSLADGMSLVKFMVNTFSAAYEEKKMETLPSHNYLWVKIIDILDFVFTLLMIPNVLLSQKLFRHMEVTSLDVPLQSDHHILVAKVEESRECLKIIKEIKQKVTDTAFIEVLIAAISKSFSDYFQAKGKDPRLTSFGLYLTVLMRKSHSQLSKENITKFRNMFSFTTLNIPITYNNSDYSYLLFWKNFKEILEKVKMETRNLNFSLNYKVTYRVFQIVPTLFPNSMVLRLLFPDYFPLIITNLPGPSAIKLFDDCLIDDIVFWIPCPRPIGMSLGFFSYDGRLQIALNVNKAIISNENDAQDIVDGIYQTLIQLDSKI